jgi:hypothetical protein
MNLILDKLDKLFLLKSVQSMQKKKRGLQTVETKKDTKTEQLHSAPKHTATKCSKTAITYYQLLLMNLST